MPDIPSTSPDLSTATTQELTDEIEQRSEAFVFIGLLKSEQRTADQDKAIVYCGGGLYTTIGLVEQTRADLLGSLKRIEE